MSKEKNIQQQVDADRKKESTSVLEKIRRRTGLLVGIVGLALVIFILESLLGSGASIFGRDEMSSVGYINGKKIDRNEFIIKLENAINNYRSNNPTAEVDDNVRANMIDNIWQNYISDLVIRPEFDEIGITVADDEVYEMVVANPVPYVVQQITDRKTGRVNEQIAGPDGSLDLVKWKQAIQNIPVENEGGIRQIEENVKTNRYFEKFRALVSKGLYLTNAEAREFTKNQSAKVSLTYVAKKYDSVSDSAVKVNDADLQKYYNEHAYEFKNPETIRKIEYVAFNVVPSPEDLAALEKDAHRVAEEFKGKTFKEDSAYMQQESENGSILVQDFTKKTMIVRDTTVFTASPGTVFGPYNEGAYFKIYKLERINSVADSARVRHILIGFTDPKTNQPKRNREQAKRQADSLLTLIKNKTVNFDTLVKTTSDDLGSIDKGGDYGWFDESKRFVEPFKNAGLMGTKGNISSVETEFGYHIIEVLDVSKGRHSSYKVAQIFKLIEPSDETNQKIFADANQFGGMNNTAELFDKGVESKKLVKRVADNIKEGDRQLPGIKQAKDLIKWAYTAKKGDVSVFSFEDKHVVAKLSSIKNKGVLPLEDVKDIVTTEVIQEKKGELFLAEFKNKAGDSKDVNAVAAKMGLQTKTIDALALMGRNVEGLGMDLTFMGTALGTKAGTTSKAVAGNMGVFMIAVNKVTSEPQTDDFKTQKKQLEQAFNGKGDFEIINALKELADVEDHRSRIE